MIYLLNCFKCLYFQEYLIQCHVCYENLYISDKKILILNCGHLLCDNCILNLNLCPLCRGEIINFYYVKNIFKCFQCNKKILSYFLKCGHCLCLKCISKLIHFEDFYYCKKCKIFSKLIKN